MYPTIFRITIGERLSIPIHSYGLMVVIGFTLALYDASRRARRSGVEPRIISDIAMMALALGILGARIMFVLLNLDRYSSLLDAFKIYEGGLIFYGGVILAAPVIIAHLVRQRVSLLVIGDICAPSLPLAIAAGRIGCFLNGCCFGKPAPVCGMTFPKQAFVYHSPDIAYPMPVHATQLYASFGALLSALILMQVFRRKRADGDALLLLPGLYGLSRFTVEFFRADYQPVAGGLHSPQILSIILIVGSAVAFVWNRRRRVGVF